MDDPGDLRGALLRLASSMARLNPGPLAILRRATPGEGSPEFWRLWHSATWPGRAEDWEWVIAAFAIVMPTGQPEDRRAPHRADLPFGRALQAAGVSELRVAGLLNTPFDQRRPHVLRLCRMLAAKDQEMDMRDLGELMLRPNAPLRKLADTYYAALAAADRKEKAE